MSVIAIAEVRPRKSRRLRLIGRVRGESRSIALAHDEAGGRIAVRLVRVESGGVDRTTGVSVRVHYELTVKLPRQPEITRTFTGQGERDKAEWNARVAYLAAQHGTVDLSLPLGELGGRLWAEPKTLTALAGLRGRFGWPDSLPRTRINTGDSDADLPVGRGAAISTRPDRPGLVRDVPAADLEAEEAAADPQPAA